MNGAERHNFTERCRLSDPLFPHSLRRRDNPPSSNCFNCGPLITFEEGDWHYYCDTCDLVFHNYSCYLCPQGMRHPYHPNHTLNTAIQYSETEFFSINKNSTEIGLFLGVHAPIRGQSFELESDKTCDWCKVRLDRLFYHCSQCNFSLGCCCSGKDPPFRIINPRSHQHSLTFFHNPISVPCNVCGLGGNEEPRYACLPCNYLVHRSCSDRPQPQVRAFTLTPNQNRFLDVPGFRYLSLTLLIIILVQILSYTNNPFMEFYMNGF